MRQKAQVKRWKAVVRPKSSLKARSRDGVTPNRSCRMLQEGEEGGGGVRVTLSESRYPSQPLRSWISELPYPSHYPSQEQLEGPQPRRRDPEPLLQYAARGRPRIRVKIRVYPSLSESIHDIRVNRSCRMLQEGERKGIRVKIREYPSLSESLSPCLSESRAA